MLMRFGAILLAASLAALPVAGSAAKPAGAVACHRAGDPVDCFVGLAAKILGRIAAADDRADAVGELLYALAVTGTRNDAVLGEARKLLAGDAVKPVKQMDLLYAIDAYAAALGLPSEGSYADALKRFAALQTQLKGGELVELYVNACSIIGWDEPARERWLDFAQAVCTPAALKQLRAEGVAWQALVLAMMPVAMTLAEDADGFVDSAGHALSWLASAEKLAGKSKSVADQDFVAFIAVLMHTMNSICLDAFDQADASDREVEQARAALRRMEKRSGISARTSALRRQVIEALFNTGRDAEAKKMLDQMLLRVDADREGKKIPLAEQVAVLLLAARLEHGQRAGEGGTCGADDHVWI